MSERTRTILLVISFAFNAFIIGAFAGGFLRGEGPNPRIEDEGPAAGASGDVLGAPQRLLPALSREDRRAVVRAAAPKIREARELRIRRQAARLEAIDVLLAEPFDEEAFRAALERSNVADQSLRRLGLEAVVDIAARMSPDARAKLAERMAEGGGSPRRGFGGRFRPGGP